MSHPKSLVSVRRIAPSKVSNNKTKLANVEDITLRETNKKSQKKTEPKKKSPKKNEPNKKSSNKGESNKKLEEKTINDEEKLRRRRRRRRICAGLTLCTAVLAAIGLATFLGVYLSRNSNNSSNEQGPTCTPNCQNNGVCISTNVCQCPTGYNGSTCGNPICNQSCVYGSCTGPNFCTCAPGYYGSTCATPNCSSNCVVGSCIAPNNCTCQAGWSGATCNTPTCSPACVNGVCTNPNICACNSGWNGSICNSAICSPSCQNNGTCTSPNNCTCGSGYNGSLCQYPICTNPCQNGGNCTAPSTCQCPSTYTGATCNIPVCTSPCQNGGNCTSPQTCTCTPQYNGSTCTIPVCSSPCLNNGNCTAPNVCTCATGYNGSVCQYAVCSPSCLNGGTCISPNVCQCIPDVWIGSYCQTPVRIFWAFDNNLNDLYNNFPGVGINGPTFSSAGITGYGTCLYLNGALNQSVIVYEPPFLNMAYTSFSLVAWVYATTLRNGSGSGTDNAIFGQHENTTLDRSLHIIIRNQKIYLGFFADDIVGNKTLDPGNWYHMAYVYDYSTLTQFVYVNGILDVSGSPKGPYQGARGNLTIGTNGVNVGYNQWDGCIDQVGYFARAKNATEVLRDATLTVSYSFDNTLLDDGPLGINGTGSNYTFSVPGRINTSLAFLANSTYVQVTGLVLLGTFGQAYSIAIWIKPLLITSGTIIHVSSYANGTGWCIPMLGFKNSTEIGVQGWNGGPVTLTGPVVSLNAWTHLVVTYSSINGIRLWVNGTQYGSASVPYAYNAASVPVTATLGSSLNGTNYCSSGGIAMGSYSGYMDQFQLYSRELSSSDIFSLANP